MGNTSESTVQNAFHLQEKGFLRDCKANGGHPASYHFSYFDGILSQSTAPIAVALACQKEEAAFTDFKHESNYRCFLIHRRSVQKMLLHR